MAFKKIISEPTPRPFISCCFSSCTNNAICSLWTRTGWANTCRVHYEQVETAPRVTRNPYLDEIRRAHAARNAARNRVEAAREREPGSDDLPLGIALDALEAELERVNP